MAVNNPVSTVTANQGGTWTVATNGDSTPGSAVPAKGIIVGGSDGANYRNFSVDSTGKLNINTVAGTVTVSGTVTATQGSPPWNVVGNVASGGSNAGNPLKMGGAFNTTQPTVTTGQIVDAQFTSRGALIISSGVDTVNVTEASAATIATNTTGLNNTVGTAGAAIPSKGIIVQGSDGSNARALKTDASGNLSVIGAVASTLSTQTTISVGSTTTVLLASNASRKGFSIVNNGTVAIYVGNTSVVSGATAIANGGQILQPNGGGWYLDNTSFTGAINGITASGTSVVSVLEW